MLKNNEITFEDNFDFLNFKNDPDILKIITTEELLFSDKIYKKNRFLFSQERYIVITNYAIYNLKGKSLKRRIDISKLKGITNSEKTLQFVLHGNEEYDYLYYSENKLIIIHIIEKIYEVLMGKTLLFSNLDIDNLKTKVTTKKEKEKNQNFSRMDDTNLTDINEFLKKNGFGEDEIYPELETENNEINVFDSSQSLYFKDSLMPINKNSEGIDNSNFFIQDEYYPLPKSSFEDFEFLKIIGKGKNSISYLGKRKNENYTCVIKSIDKVSLIENETFENLITEKKILTSINILSSNLLITKILFCFQTINKIFFVFPFYKGGDLFSYVEKEGGKLNENKIKFIISELVITLLKLHENKIIYRNIKKENILIDEKGHIKLVDFSKSKILLFEGDYGTSFIGTPEYMAPEIILGKEQTFSVDWYMLGILIYDLFFGYSPFNDSFIDRIFYKIINGFIYFDDNVFISQNLKDLILNLLKFESENRIGDKGIKHHPFFEGVNWDKYEFCLCESPIKTNFTYKNDDVSNFDQDIVNEDIVFDNFIQGEDLVKIKSAQEKGIFNFFD